MAIYNKSFSFKLGSLSSKKAFTLVELIIVITILAILATIAFISFQGYNKNARDGNRLATVRNIEKGLELYQLKTTFYPIPENITGTGVIGGDTVNFVGVVGEEISKVIGIGKGPKDPSSDNYYVYGLSENKRKYQIGITLEKLESSVISKTAYADTYYAKVLGNYTYPLKLNSKLYSMPSLLFVGPSITDLATFTGFVVDKGTNLPYGLNGNVANTKNITALLQEITGTSATLSLTGVDISSYSSNLALKGADTIAIETALGIKKDLVGQAVFGKSYYSNDLVTNTTSSGTTTPPPATTCTSWTYSTGACQPNGTASLTVLTSLPSGCTGGTPITTTTCTYIPANSCSTTLPTNATTTIGTPTSINQAWQNTNSSNPCYFTCASGYGYNGSACVSATNCATGIEEITLSNGQTWSCKNLGATIVRDGSTKCVNGTACYSQYSWAGNYYQWGRIDTTWVQGSTDWGATNNSWGGSTTTPTAGTYSTVSFSDKTLMKGPCPSGWHVPTAYEWKLACDSISGTSCAYNSTTVTAMQTKLKLPFAGIRAWSDGTYRYQSAEAFYCSSSSNGSPNAYYLYFSVSDITQANGGNRANGFSVRCLKN